MKNVNLNINVLFFADQVGPPISCCHIKLVDVPEMEYFSKNGQGEVSGFHSMNWDFVNEQKINSVNEISAGKLV